MTTPAENHAKPSDHPALPKESPVKAIAFGTAGLVTGIGGYLTVMLLSRVSGWWSAPYITSLLICGTLAVILGMKANLKSGKLSRWKILVRILGIMSTVIGAIIVGLVGSMLLLMLMLSGLG